MREWPSKVGGDALHPMLSGSRNQSVGWLWGMSEIPQKMRRGLQPLGVEVEGKDNCRQWEDLGFSGLSQEYDPFEQKSQSHLR